MGKIMKEKIVQISRGRDDLAALTDKGNLFVCSKEGSSLEWYKLKLPKELTNNKVS